MNDYNWQIDEHYQIRSMNAEEFDPFFQKYTKQFFDDETKVFRLRDALSDNERSRLKKLCANMGEPFILRLGVFHKGEFVGWHYGRQGFVITALEVTDIFGSLIHLYYFPKEIRRKMMDYRIGQIKPDAEVKKYLGF